MCRTDWDPFYRVPFGPSKPAINVDIIYIFYSFSLLTVDELPGCVLLETLDISSNQILGVYASLSDKRAWEVAGF